MKLEKLADHLNEAMAIDAGQMANNVTTRILGRECAGYAHQPIVDWEWLWLCNHFLDVFSAKKKKEVESRRSAYVESIKKTALGAGLKVVEPDPRPAQREKYTLPNEMWAATGQQGGQLADQAQLSQYAYQGNVVKGGQLK